MFLYSLLALAVVTALIFAAPLKAKVWATLAVVAAGALWASATAVGVLAGGHTVRLWATDVFLFGSDAGSMDPLSALFALIVSVGAVAAVLYSRGYLAHYLGRKSPAHISLHYTALATNRISRNDATVISSPKKRNENPPSEVTTPNMA